MRINSLERCGDTDDVAADNEALPLEPVPHIPDVAVLPGNDVAKSAWKKIVTWGSIKGTVRYNGAPVTNAHVWVSLPG